MDPGLSGQSLHFLNIMPINGLSRGTSAIRQAPLSRLAAGSEIKRVHVSAKDGSFAFAFD